MGPEIDKARSESLVRVLGTEKVRLLLVEQRRHLDELEAE